MKHKIDKYQAVYIEWLDSTMRLPAWHSTGNLIEETRQPQDTFKTVAFLVSQNKHEYILANSIHLSEGDVIQFGQVFTIPKGCVTLIKKIKIITRNKRH